MQRYDFSRRRTPGVLGGIIDEVAAVDVWRNRKGGAGVDGEIDVGGEGRLRRSGADRQARGGVEQCSVTLSPDSLTPGALSVISVRPQDAAGARLGAGLTVAIRSVSGTATGAFSEPAFNTDDSIGISRHFGS